MIQKLYMLDAIESRKERWKVPLDFSGVTPCNKPKLHDCRIELSRRKNEQNLLTRIFIASRSSENEEKGNLLTAQQLSQLTCLNQYAPQEPTGHVVFE
jgi:hypothetical protein